MKIGLVTPAITTISIGADSITDDVTPLAPLYDTPVTVYDTAQPGDVVTTFTPQPGAESGLPLTMSLSDVSGCFALEENGGDYDLKVAGDEGPASNAAAIEGPNNYLYRNADLIGNQDSDTVTISFWANTASGATGSIYTAQETGDGNRTCNVFFNGGYLYFIFLRPGTTITIMQGYAADVADGEWHHYLLSLDLNNTSLRSLYIDDVEKGVTWPIYNTSDTLDFTRQNHLIGRSQDASIPYVGNLMHLYIDQTYRDLSVEANRRLFVTSDGVPAQNQAALNPILYMPLNEVGSYGSNEGTGGDFTIVGDIDGVPDVVAPPFEAGETYPITVRTTEASEGKFQDEDVNVQVVEDPSTRYHGMSNVSESGGIITYPEGTEEGDLLILVRATRNSVAYVAANGFTLQSQRDSGEFSRLWVDYRYVGVDETSTPFSIPNTNHTVSQIFVFKNVHPTVPFVDVTTYGTSTNSGTNFRAPYNSVQTANAGSLWAFAVCERTAVSGPVTVTGPSVPTVPEVLTDFELHSVHGHSSNIPVLGFATGIMAQAGTNSGTTQTPVSQSMYDHAGIRMEINPKV